MAYLYDPDGAAELLMNTDTLVTCPVTVEHWASQLRDLVERHHAETKSRKAADLLQNWESALPASFRPARRRCCPISHIRCRTRVQRCRRSSAGPRRRPAPQLPPMRG